MRKTFLDRHGKWQRGQVRVETAYDADRYFDGSGAKLEMLGIKLAKKHKGMEVGAGMGFGMRDVSYADFPSVAAAESFMAELAKQSKNVFLVDTEGYGLIVERKGK